MPLQNRVDAFGELIAVAARGTMLGNRGGRFHHAIGLWANGGTSVAHGSAAAWNSMDVIATLWGKYYTELFFLDEVTAFSAGHRPCFECRRKDAETFAALWPDRPNPDRRPRAAEMDLVLHSERLNGRLKRKHPMSMDDLPDGAMIEFDGFAWAIRGKSLLRWTPAGYRERRHRPGGIEVSVLTPPSIVEVLAAGYRPQWHPSGESGRVLEPKDRDFPRGR